MACSKQDATVINKYDKLFNVKGYLDMYYSDVTEYEDFFLRNIHKAFTSGQVKGERILEIGCGPVVHHLASASKICSSVTYSDFSEVNRNYFKKWLSSDDTDTSHMQFFKFIAELEGFTDLESGASIIKKRLQSKAVGVFRCDVFDSKPIDSTEKNFDIVFSGGCIECAAEDREMYVCALKNIASLLKPGGYLILNGFTGGDYWFAGDVKFTCLNYDSKFTKESLENSGFNVLEITDFKPNTPDILGPDKHANCSDVFFAVARKI